MRSHGRGATGWGAALGLALLMTAASAQAQPPPSREEAWSRIADHVARRREAEALRLLEALPEAERRRPEAALLRGRLLERRGDLRPAAESYAQALERGPDLPAPVRRDLHARRATLLARSGGCREARPVLLELARGRGEEAALFEARAAECALALGELEAATRELERVIRRAAGPVDTFAARVSLAEAQARAGDREGSAQTLHRALIERPEHPDAERALAALTELGGGPPSFTFAERMQRAERLVERRMHQEAIAELEAVGEPTQQASRARWLHLMGTALYRSRRAYGRASEVLTRAAREGSPEAGEDEFHAARALSRIDRDAEAIRGYRRFAQRYPQHRLAVEALFLAAWLELRLGRASGEEQMRRVIPRARGTRWAQQARWELAMRAYERGRYRQAEELFVDWARAADSPVERVQGHYWRGRAAQRQRGHGNEAIAAYRAALRELPLHWYALLARQRLVEMDVDPGEPFPEAPAEGEPPAGGSGLALLPPAARLYARLGLMSEAREALSEEEEAVRGGGDRSEGLSRLIRAHTAIGGANRSWRLTSARVDHLRRRPGPAERWLWEGAYPRPFPAAAEEAARAQGLLPAHLYAIMRQESGYNPDVVSYADAIGLMQIIPSAAESALRSVPRSERDGGLRREMIFDPIWNLRLGAILTRRRLDRFGLPLCFAAYNAGIPSVTRWLADRGESDLDVFVERIPYEQTRNYIRRVTTHFARYLYLEHPERGWPLTLPLRVGPAQRRDAALAADPEEAEGPDASEPDELEEDEDGEPEEGEEP